MSFALDQLQRLNTDDPSGRFRGRFDIDRIGAFGHSLGGATALQFCHDDPRCKACLDVDGGPWGSVVREGISQPLLFLMSDHRGESDPETRQIVANFGSLFGRLPAAQWSEIMIRGSNHYMFSDAAVLRSPLIMSVLRALHVVGIDGRRQISVAAHFINAFFDVQLNSAPASVLRRRPGYPEVEYIH